MYIDAPYPYRRHMVPLSDGSHVAFARIEGIPKGKLEFHSVHAESRDARLAYVATLRLLKLASYGVENPLVIVWDAFSHSHPSPLRLDSALREGHHDTVYLSMNSYISHHIREVIASGNFDFRHGRLVVKKVFTPFHVRASEIIERLYAENRIGVFSSEPDLRREQIIDTIDAARDCIAVGQIGYPSTYARDTAYPIVFNASYFLFESEDYMSPFSLFGEAYNLHIHAGRVVTPPLYSRSALLVGSDGKINMRQVKITDMHLTALGRSWNLGEFALNTESDYSVYTRMFGVAEHGRTIGASPLKPGQVDFLLVGRSIVGMRRGGGLDLPQNGFVLSVPESILEQCDLTQLDADYELTCQPDVLEAIQCGPGLVAQGEPILSSGSFDVEEFFPRRTRADGVVDPGVSPTDYCLDPAGMRAGRIVVGVCRDDSVVLLGAEGVNSGMAIPVEDSAGATLDDMVSLATEAGCYCALNLDGGGSANIRYMGGALLRTGDRRCMPGVVFERMVPTVGVII